MDTLSIHKSRLTNANRLFHVSEEPDIQTFSPRPSPSKFDSITGDVVFAVAEMLLHNYLLPRDCPRVTFYASGQTSLADKDKFIGESEASHVIVVESGWYQRIAETKLYCYEFPTSNFSLLDECAGYYISYAEVTPMAVTPVNNIIDELLSRKIELRLTPSLAKLAAAVSQSSLNFSLIRMRNAGRCNDLF